MSRKGADTATLAPYLPRLAIEWAVSDPSTTFRVVDGSLVFADISGFTALSERLAAKGRVGAEELTETLSRCFADLLAVAYEAGGSLLKFGGDALLLFFDGEEHAQRACASALRMRAAMGEVGRVSTSVGNVRLRMSLGVHSGELHFFRVGGSHRELILTGPGATRTVEMESAAEANEIVVSPATAARIDPRLLGADKGPGVLLRKASVDLPTGLATDAVEAGPHAAVALPAALREELLAGDVEPEHRHVSIAFVHFDEVDQLIEARGPAAVADALDTLVKDVQAAAEEHGVTFLASDVDKDGGKLILVAGAPRAFGDDEGRMLRCLRQIADGERTVPIRIGVNHGHVFVGEVGPAFRRTYTVMGDAVNLAARLMAKAAPGQVLASGAVLDHSATEFEAEPLPPFMVKGKSQPVQAYALGAQGRRRVDEQGLQLPMFGRDAELAELTSALDRAANGSGGLVVISGQAGIGKSRVVEQLTERAEGFTVLRAFCEPYETQTPYYAFRFLLRAVAGVQTGGVEGGAQLGAAVSVAAPALLPWLPLLATVADVDVDPTDETTLLEPRFRRQKTQRVVAELLQALARGPLLMVVEDGQWLDALSAELLDAVAAAAARQPWLVCLAQRDDEAEHRGSALLHLQLGPLDEAAARSLLTAATEGAPLLPHQRDALIAQAGGNPLFLEELVRARTDAADDEPLPETLEAVVAAQVDRLPPSDRRLLRYTSVLGTTFDASLLAAVTGGQLRTAGAAMRRFPTFLEADRSGLVRFRNQCYRQVAYDALSFGRRRQLHDQVGQALEAATAGREAERAATLSYHFLHAQRHDRCWRYAVVAAERARASYANIEAAELYERALSVRRRLDIEPEELASTWEALGDVTVRAGDFDRARRAFRQARALRVDQPLALAELCSKEYRAALHQGQSDSALRWIRRGLRLLEGGEGMAALASRAELRYSYANHRQQGGRPRQALRWSELAIEDALTSGNQRALVRAYLVQDWALMALGRTEEATHAARALPVCEEIGDPSLLGDVLLYLGNFAYMQGKWNEGLGLWGRAVEAYTRAGNTVNAAFGASNSAEILLNQGRYDEAEARLREALEVWQSMGYSAGVGDVLGNLGRLALNRGDIDQATRLFEEVRALFASANDGREIGACGALAECLLRRGATSEALGVLEQAIHRETQSGDTAFAAMLHRVRGYAYAGMGKLADAWADFDESLAVARRRGAAYEVALTLEAISVVAQLGGLPLDASADAERTSLLAQLGVEVMPPPPLAMAA